MKDFNSYFESIPELETERLRLTAFTREDMDAYFDILRDPKVQKYLGGGVPVFDKEPHIIVEKLSTPAGNSFTSIFQE